MRKLPVLLAFTAFVHSSALAGPGLLNSSFEEVAAILGKASSHEHGDVAGIKYDRYHFEQHGWKTAVLFIDGKTQKLETQKSDGSALNAQEKTTIFEAYDATGPSSKLRGWHQLTENHFIRQDGRVHAITHVSSMTVFLDDLPRDFL
jgi:hypothetical protein